MSGETKEIMNSHREGEEEIHFLGVSLPLLNIHSVNYHYSCMS